MSPESSLQASWDPLGGPGGLSKRLGRQPPRASWGGPLWGLLGPPGRHLGLSGSILEKSWRTAVKGG
eukprot:828618-Pyramimonas_sp.AAC.1